MRILIVEDDLISRRYLELVSKKYGECCVCGDGVEAVEAVKKVLLAGEKYDLIFLDIMIPKKTGLDVLKEIRIMEQENGFIASRKSIIIMVTALSESDVVKEAFENLANGYFVKPLSREKIDEVLRQCSEQGGKEG